MRDVLRSGWRIMWLRTEKCPGCLVDSSIERLQVTLPECTEPVLTWTLVCGARR